MAPFTAWTDTCCDILQRYAESDGDYALSYLVRFGSFTNAVKEAIHEGTSSSEHQTQLVLSGLEAQSQALRQGMIHHIARSGKHPPITITEHYLKVQQCQ